MLHLSTVESTTLELLKKLQQLPVLCNTRLVGGTALALQLGHRKSVDLDFFGQINVDSQDLKEALREYISEQAMINLRTVPNQILFMLMEVIRK